ncbi:hypothetical protein [Bacteroides uniformis]|uniref:hypothetical protein n=1 Tax=Bacteroides uniformis TaxID=820 RepID=UPI0039845967
MANTSVLNWNTIELHYWFNDDSHTMNAVVFNKCEYEFLGIAKEIAQKLKVDLEIETEPLAEGGLRSWFKFKAKDKDAIKVGVILYIITTLLGTPLTTTIEELTRMAIQSVFESTEVKQLKEQKEIADLKLDIARIEAETKRLSRSIDENVVKKKRSNYYENISTCKKIKKVTIDITDDLKKNIYLEREVIKADFPNYIMTSDDLEPDNDENAVIEIISPVLKKGKYKWSGIYKGEVIQFTMKSNEFKTLVQIGQVIFKNGSSINCHLLTHKKVNAEGDVKITGYEVVLVNHYFENDKPIETPEGKRYRQIREAESNQLTLFDHDNI